MSTETKAKSQTQEAQVAEKTKSIELPKGEFKVEIDEHGILKRNPKFNQLDGMLASHGFYGLQQDFTMKRNRSTKMANLAITMNPTFIQIEGRGSQDGSKKLRGIWIAKKETLDDEKGFSAVYSALEMAAQFVRNEVGAPSLKETMAALDKLNA